MSSEGSREIEAARKRLAAAKAQVTVASNNIEMITKMLEGAQSQLVTSQKEAKEAEAMLKDAEKRWEVIDVDSDDDSKQGNEGSNKRRKVSLSPQGNNSTMSNGNAYAGINLAQSDDNNERNTADNGTTAGRQVGASTASSLSNSVDQVDNNVNSQSSREKEYKAPPDMHPTVRDKLECCQMVLHPSFKKYQLSKSSPLSVVSSMEDDIKDFMTKSIQTGTSIDGMTLPSPGFLHICGGLGTGKVNSFFNGHLYVWFSGLTVLLSSRFFALQTTAVNSCVDEMKKWAERNGYDKPRFCGINMALISTKAGLGTMLKKNLATAVEIDKEAPLSTLEKQFKKTTVVLILDKIDMLFSHQNGDIFFKRLVHWAENREFRFSMIGISNCINGAIAERIRKLGHVSESADFAFLMVKLALAHRFCAACCFPVST